MQKSFIRIGSGLRRLGLPVLAAAAVVGGGVAYHAGMQGADVASPAVNAELAAMIAAQMDAHGRAVPVATVEKQPEPVDLNKATLEQLDAMPGIGPAKAQAIFEARKARRGFKRIDELLDVPGIGAKTLDKLKPYLIMEPTG